MEWLTRQDIDRLLEQLSADDLIESMTTEDEHGAKMPMRALNRVGLRLGVGTQDEPATQRIRPGDLKYLIERFGEVVNIDSPLPESTAASLDSVSTGVLLPEE